MIERTNQRGTKRFVAVSLASILLAGGCDSAAPAGSAPGRGTLTLPVDATLVPSQPAVGARALARMMGESGIAMDFFLGELVVSTNDDATLDAFVKRWGATIVSSTEAHEGTVRLHHLQLDPSAAVVSDLLLDVNDKAPELQGAFRSSSDAAAKLLAVAL